jgi:hypothetical protein
MYLQTLKEAIFGDPASQGMMRFSKVKNPGIIINQTGRIILLRQEARQHLWEK